jgi:hypothetical protein
VIERADADDAGADDHRARMGLHGCLPFPALFLDRRLLANAGALH